MLKVLAVIPSPENVTDVNTKYSDQVRFTWKETRYIVYHSLHVSTVDRGMEIGSDKAMLLADMLMRHLSKIAATNAVPEHVVQHTLMPEAGATMIISVAFPTPQVINIRVEEILASTSYDVDLTYDETTRLIGILTHLQPMIGTPQYEQASQD